MVFSHAVSQLLLDVLFEEAEPRFLYEVLASPHEKKLGALAGKWFGDARLQMRSMLLDYVDDGCDRAHHRALVKRLFKAAEEAGDDELMGRFMVAFDRIPRRIMGERRFYDYGSLEVVTRTAVVADPDIPTHAGQATERSRFSRATRRYIVRRAWRYFRYLGFREPERYITAISAALAHYRDADLDDPAKLLDAWGLVHALYWGSEVLERPPRGVRLAANRALSSLEPAPFRPELWQTEHAFEPLLTLAAQARSRPVAEFALSQLRQHHAEAMRGLDLARLRPLIDSDRDEVQRFAAELLEHASGFDKLPVRTWLILLATRNVHALPQLCALFEAHVRPSRLSFDQRLALASAKAHPVAQLGLKWLREQAGDAPDREALAPLLRAPLQAIREEAATWLTGLLRSSNAAGPEDVRELLDAPHAEVRQQALSLVEDDPRFTESGVIWSAMAESPHPEVQHRLVYKLSASTKGSLDETSRRHLWRSTLLAVRSGSRAKKHALRQVAAALCDHPEQAELLLPLLGIALRSVRPPERRHALAAVARTAFAHPELRATIGRVMPELQLFEAEAGR